VTYAALTLASLGTAFLLLAAVGVVRMPDLFTRLQASSKAGTLGAALLLGGAAVFFADGPITVRLGMIGVFLVLTAPVAAHALARVGYLAGPPDGSSVDELAGRYGDDHRLD